MVGRKKKASKVDLRKTMAESARKELEAARVPVGEGVGKQGVGDAGGSGDKFTTLICPNRQETRTLISRIARRRKGEHWWLDCDGVPQPLFCSC